MSEKTVIIKGYQPVAWGQEGYQPTASAQKNKGQPPSALGSVVIVNVKPPKGGTGEVTIKK